MIELGILESLFVFMLGSAVGSFTNVLIYRLPRNISIVKPASHCPSCKSKIAFYDNIPIVSFVLLGGKCRKCGAKISPRYFFVEFLMGTTYLLTVLFLRDNFLLAGEILLLLPAFISLTLIDIEQYIIPDALSIWIALVGLVFSFLTNKWDGLLMSIAGAVVGALVMFFVAFGGKKIFGKEALGEGDIVLTSALGTLSGPVGILGTIFFSALLGSAVGIALWTFQRFRHREISRVIPFGPFLCLSAIIVLIYGKTIWDFYLRLHRFL